MTAAVANSLASKLTPVELSAIINIREKLRKRDEEVAELKEEYNDLVPVEYINENQVLELWSAVAFSTILYKGISITYHKLSIFSKFLPKQNTVSNLKETCFTK